MLLAVRVVSAQVPAITAISPLSGAAGSTVNITGQNFSPESDKNFVRFGSVRAGILEASATMLKVLVPSGCGAGYIYVTVNGLTAFSHDLFIPSFNNAGVFNAASFTRPEPVFEILDASTEIIRAADFDGDGWPDLMVAKSSLQVFLNLHDGRFSEALNTGIGPYNSGCLLEDFNMDGKIDMVCIDYIQSRLRFFKNTSSPGAVSFEIMVIPSAVMCNKMASGDLDSDGKPDLALSDESTTDVAITIWRNTSTADSISFEGAGLFGAYGDEAPVGIAIGDINGDNVQDLVVGLPDKIVAGFNTTPGGIDLVETTIITNFLGQPWQKIQNLTLLDLNADHKKDIIAGIPHLLSYQNYCRPDTVDFRLADTLGIGPYDFQFDEFNGDGLIDITCMTYYHLYLFPNKSTLTDVSFYYSPADFIYQYYSTALALQNTATGDFDRDGKVDIAMIEQNTLFVNILWNQTPDSQYKKPVVSSLSAYSGEIGDTIVITGENFDPAIYKNIVFFEGIRAKIVGGRPGSLSVVVPATPLYGPVTVIAHGLAGRSAKCFSPWKGGKFSINANTFKLEYTIPLPMQGISHDMADIDGDRKMDFVELQCNGSTGFFIVGRNKGAPGVLDYQLATFSTIAMTSNLHLADLDNDAWYDYICGSDQENNYELALEKNISSPGLIAYDEDNVEHISCSHCILIKESAFGDLNNDGKDEAAVVSSVSKSVSLFRNRTNGKDLDFELDNQYYTGNYPVGAVIAELSGDSYPEVVVINKNDISVDIFQNTSDGSSLTLGTKMTLRGVGSPYYPMNVTIADMDGDERNDIIVATHDQAFLIYLNSSHDNTLSFASMNVLYMSDNGQPLGIDIADINGDQKPDIVVSDSRVDKYSMVVIENYSMPGQVRLGNPIGYGEINNYTTTARASDLDMDGIPDVLITGYYGNLFFFINYATGDPYNENNLHIVESTNDFITATDTAILIGSAVYENHDNQGILVYPNPASDKILIEFKSPVPGKVMIRLRDILGKVVYEENITADIPADHKVMIPAKDITSSGIYLIEIISDTGITCRKVVIE